MYSCIESRQLFIISTLESQFYFKDLVKNSHTIIQQLVWKTLDMIFFLNRIKDFKIRWIQCNFRSSYYNVLGCLTVFSDISMG